MSEKSHQDPHASYNFVITITGLSDDGHVVHGAFLEVSGLENEMSPVEHRKGSDDITVQKLSGLEKFTNITLKRGVSTDQGILSWIQKAKSDQMQRANGFIVLLDDREQVLKRWKFSNAWPRKFIGPDLNAASNEVAIEALEICHEGLEIDDQD